MSLILDLSRIAANSRRTPQHERFHIRALAAADWMLAYPIPPALDLGPPEMLKAVPPPPGLTSIAPLNRGTAPQTNLTKPHNPGP